MYFYGFFDNLHAREAVDLVSLKKARIHSELPFRITVRYMFLKKIYSQFASKLQGGGDEVPLIWCLH